jgi:DUF438 domain-containing protein
MVNKILTDRFTKIILQAQKADAQGLLSLRKRIMKAVGTFGARQFVTITAQVLKDNFNIEGCNDPRITLKRIFSISLEELEGDLSKTKNFLPKSHPIYLLSEDHRESVRKLRALDFYKENEVNDFHKELSFHIKKEEEVLFPALEKNGMNEHPESLRNEHKEFKDMLSKIPGASMEEKTRLKEKFISAVANHIFRETHIFYPAALEFIIKKSAWDEIRQRFDSVA